MASSEVEDHSEVEVDDSRPLDVCTVDEAVEKIGFGVFQVIVTIFAGLKSVSVVGTGAPGGGSVRTCHKLCCKPSAVVRLVIYRTEQPRCHRESGTPCK